MIRDCLYDFNNDVNNNDEWIYENKDIKIYYLRCGKLKKNITNFHY